MGGRPVHDQATTPCLSVSSLAASPTVQHISVRRAPLQDFFSFASSISINSMTSVDAMLQGTRVRMLEMRLKMQHKLPRVQTQGKSMDHGAVIGLKAATDLNHRHLLTLESTLGSDKDRQYLSTFVSSKFESKLSWGIAISHKVHQTLTFFSRYNSDDNARNRFILQAVHKLNEETTLSPIVAVSTGCHPQGGISLKSQLTEIGFTGDYLRVGFLGGKSIQNKGFYSGGGAYSLSIKAQGGQID